MAGSSGAEPIAAGEQLMQLDQAITLTLQEIDENFSQSHQIITSRVLPAIHEYEASCSKTWHAARFWKQFFEASAQVSLTQAPLEEADEYASEHVPPEEVAEYESLQSPPRLTDTQAPFETPFERLKRDVECSRAEDSMRAQSIADESLAAPRTGIDRRAPVTADASIANEPSITMGDAAPRSSSPLKGRRPSARPRVSIVPGEGGMPINPFARAEQTWDGIADLRTTPLLGSRAQTQASFASPRPVLPPDVRPDMSRSTRRRSVIGTPLTRKNAPDALPTPPTITKVHAPAELPHADTTSRASLLIDADEGLPSNLDRDLSRIPGMLDSMLDMDAAVSDEEEPGATDSTSTATKRPGNESKANTSARSHSIEDDTLFGVHRAPSSSKRDASRSLSNAVRRSSAELRMLGEL